MIWMTNFIVRLEYIIKEYGKYESQTRIGSRAIPEANGFAYWR